MQCHCDFNRSVMIFKNHLICLILCLRLLFLGCCSKEKGTETMREDAEHERAESLGELR